MRALVISMGAVALTVAACSQGSGDAKKADAASGEASGGAVAAAAVAGQGPKPGLWRATMTAEGLPPGAAPTFDICTTERKFEPPKNGPQQMPENVRCTDVNYQPIAGGGFEGSATCQLPNNMTMEQHTKVSGDYDSRYVMETTVKMTPAPAGMGEQHTTMTFERVGDCPTGTPAGIVKKG